MESSTSSSELFDSEPAAEHPRARRNRRRLAVGGVALVAVAAAGAGVVGTLRSGPASQAVEFVDSWVDAWNDRDAQQVSSMTCDYIPAFVSAGDIEGFLGMLPSHGPVIPEHSVISTRSAVLGGRPGVWVKVSYVPADTSSPRERSVFVRVRGDAQPCIGYFSVW